MGKRKTTEEFIKESEEKFGEGRFGYDRTNYKDAKTNVTITCHKHGDFLVTPDSHLAKKSKGGCKECKKERIRESKLSNTKEFIEKSKELYGDKFGYDRTVYRGYDANITITCFRHGDFTTTPEIHLAGKSGGCKKCKGEHIRKSKLSNTKEFIEKSKELYGDKFGYDRTVYRGDRIEVIITCHKHGDFLVTPNHHLAKKSKGGCKECKGERIKELKSSTTEEFIEKSKELYGDKFGYDKTVYINRDTEVTITCLKHGDFSVKPSVHLDKRGCGGCSRCKSSKLEDEIRKFLTESGIKFREQEPFSWLIGPNGGPQTLDFYLPDLGIGIECQGGQHFYAIDIFGGEEGFKNTQERDQNKQKLCKEHGIDLIYYSNLSTPDKPFDYPYPVYEDGAKLIEKLMSMLNDDMDAEDTAQN